MPSVPQSLVIRTLRFIELRKQYYRYISYDA